MAVNLQLVTLGIYLTEMYLTLKLASISVKDLVFPLRAPHTKLNSKKNTEKLSKNKNIYIQCCLSPLIRYLFIIFLHFVLIQQIFVIDEDL